MGSKHAFAITLSSAVILVSASAAAQQPPPPPTVTTPPPAPMVAAAAPADNGPNEHLAVSGHLGVTYFGISQVPIGTGAGSTAAANVSAPAIGIRYWLNDSLGIDAGLGFGMASGSTTTTTGGTSTTTNAPSATAFLLHGGVPLALASSRHFVFEVVPEANLGLAFGSTSAPAPGGGNQNVSLNGFRLNVGARVGGEIHFGFIGVPQLSLLASVGLYLNDQSWGSSTSNPSTSAGGNSLTIGTSVQGDPWAIFANNIAAIYYF
jgi:hypothetical protein